MRILRHCYHYYKRTCIRPPSLSRLLHQQNNSWVIFCSRSSTTGTYDDDDNSSSNSNNSSSNQYLNDSGGDDDNSEMSFSSRRRNYLLTPHRRDGLIEWMKSMLQHSFVLDSLETTGADTFEHFEMLIEEHRERQSTSSNTAAAAAAAGPLTQQQRQQPSRLQLLVPTTGIFHTPLPLREAFTIYNEKHKLTKRKHIQISFNEIRHILNLAQIMALRKKEEQKQQQDQSDALESNKLNNKIVNQKKAPLSLPSHGSSSSSSSTTLESMTTTTADNTTTPQFNGPKLISFDGDQTLYSDGANFESNLPLARYLYQLLRHGVSVAVVTAAGYEYQVQKYEYRLSGLLRYFQLHGLTPDECSRFYLFGGECNYLLRLGQDYKLQAVPEHGPGGWFTATQNVLPDAPVHWQSADVDAILDLAQMTLERSTAELALRGRVIRKKRSVGLVPNRAGAEIPRESLDECVLRCHEVLQKMNNGAGTSLPFCSFNGGTDAWVDVGNKRVGVEILQSYCGIAPIESLHIGDQFLNTGNDYAARAVSPCVWITNPQETTYILKSILRLAGVPYALHHHHPHHDDEDDDTQVPTGGESEGKKVSSPINFAEMERRAECAKKMDVYTGDMVASGNK